MLGDQRAGGQVGRAVVNDQLGGLGDHADLRLLPAVDGEPDQRDQQAAAQAERQRKVHCQPPSGQYRHSGQQVADCCSLPPQPMQIIVGGVARPPTANSAPTAKVPAIQRRGMPVSDRRSALESDSRPSCAPCLESGPASSAPPSPEVGGCPSRFCCVRSGSDRSSLFKLRSSDRVDVPRRSVGAPCPTARRTLGVVSSIFHDCGLAAPLRPVTGQDPSCLLTSMPSTPMLARVP